MDCLPYGSEQSSPTLFAGVGNLKHHTCYFPYRGSHQIRFLFQKGLQAISRVAFGVFGYLHPVLLSPRALKFEALLEKIDADVYMGYNIDTLMTINRVAGRKNAFTIFDCQEFYSDMGDGQTALHKKIIAAVEPIHLAQCDLVLAASEDIAQELSREYKIRKPLALYNVPPAEQSKSSKKEDGFTLYWRNTTLDLGHRGLGDAIDALKILPEDITLHIQGNLAGDGGQRLSDTIEKQGLTRRVILHPPYLPHEAVKAAAAHTVGLCLERATSRNHLLTVSNKMFDYFMAGLPVIASGVPGLKRVIDRSEAGLLYEPGNSADLADKILRVYNDRSLRNQFETNARSFALAEGNLDKELTKLTDAFLELTDPASRQVA